MTEQQNEWNEQSVPSANDRELSIEPRLDGAVGAVDQELSLEDLAQRVRVRLSGPRRGPRTRRVESVDVRQHLTARQRLLVLDTWARSKLPAREFADLFGLSAHTLYAWKKRFDEEGPAGLEADLRGAPRGSRMSETTKRAILPMKSQHPEWGQDRLRAGAVWTLDWMDPDPPLEAPYTKLLVVRDLVSEWNLLSLPCAGEDGGLATRELERLIARYGPPAVLKRDNGKSLCNGAMDLVCAHSGILALTSPQRCPGYNGACEAGIGSLKMHAHHLATAAGRGTRGGQRARAAKRPVRRRHVERASSVW